MRIYKCRKDYSREEGWRHRTRMWRVIDHTDGRIRGALKGKWGSQAARDALEERHMFGAAMDVVLELEYLGFKLHKDFELRPGGQRRRESVVTSG